MDRKETLECIKVMQAFVDGETICNDFMTITTNPKWNWADYSYTVLPKPKYRPYSKINPNWLNKFVKNKDSNYIAKINKLDLNPDTNRPINVNAGGSWLKYQEFFDTYEWIDENLNISPCGELDN